MHILTPEDKTFPEKGRELCPLHIHTLQVGLYKVLYIFITWI